MVAPALASWLAMVSILLTAKASRSTPEIAFKALNTSNETIAAARDIFPVYDWDPSIDEIKDDSTNKTSIEKPINTSDRTNASYLQRLRWEEEKLKNLSIDEIKDDSTNETSIEKPINTSDRTNASYLQRLQWEEERLKIEKMKKRNVGAIALAMPSIVVVIICMTVYAQRVVPVRGKRRRLLPSNDEAQPPDAIVQPQPSREVLLDWKYFTAQYITGRAKQPTSQPPT